MAEDSIKLLRRTAHRCFYCRRTFEQIAIIYPNVTAIRTVDHFIAKDNGGSEHKRNKVIACFKCNTIKTNYSPEYLLSFLESKIRSGGIETYKLNEVQSFFTQVMKIFSHLKSGKLCGPYYFIEKEQVYENQDNIEIITVNNKGLQKWLTEPEPNFHYA